MIASGSTPSPATLIGSVDLGNASSIQRRALSSVAGTDANNNALPRDTRNSPVESLASASVVPVGDDVASGGAPPPTNAPKNLAPNRDLSSATADPAMQ